MFYERDDKVIYSPRDFGEEFTLSAGSINGIFDRIKQLFDDGQGSTVHDVQNTLTVPASTFQDSQIVNGSLLTRVKTGIAYKVRGTPFDNQLGDVTLELFEA